MFILLAMLTFVIAVALVIIGYLNDSKLAIISGIVFLIGSVMLTVMFFNTAEGQRTVKSWTSNTTGGLTRTVEVYDQQGNILKSYEGKLDIQGNDYGNKVLFDINGKRVVIYNAIVITEEQ